MLENHFLPKNSLLPQWQPSRPFDDGTFFCVDFAFDPVVTLDFDPVVWAFLAERPFDFDFDLVRFFAEKDTDTV